MRTHTPRALGRPLAALVAAALLAGCADRAPLAPERQPTRPAPARAAADTAVAATLSARRFAYALSHWLPSEPGTWPAVARYRYNSAGGAITFTRLATGAYRADFEGLGRPGITLDNPDGIGTETVVATSARVGVTCNPTSWFSWGATSRLTARVDCVDLATRQPADAQFTILVVGDASLPERSAFALADRPAATLYAPAARWRYTSGPGPIGVSRTAVGDWDWRMGTGSPQGAIHLVNAHTATEDCKVVAYESLGPRVRCYGAGSQPRDVEYQVLQVSRGRPGKRFGFAWADQPTRTAPYAPHPAYVHNSAGGAVEVQRRGVGIYTVTFDRLPSQYSGLEGNVQVTAFGPAHTACTAAGGWGNTADNVSWGVRVWVHCTDASGRLADSRFNVVLIE